MEEFIMKAGSYPEGIRVRHNGKPSEPFAKEGAFGSAIRVTPAGSGIPAQAFVQWDGFETWEKLTDLSVV